MKEVKKVVSGYAIDQEHVERLAIEMCARIQASLKYPKKTNKKRKEYTHVVFRITCTQVEG